MQDEGFDGVVGGLGADNRTLASRALARNAKRRRSISVRTPVYEAARDVAQASGSSGSAVTEALLVMYLRGEIDVELLTMAVTKQPTQRGPAAYQAYFDWIQNNE